MPLTYHAGQIEVQEEANTRRVADNLAHWVGPVGEFCEVADLIILDAADADGVLRFAAVSGDAPLIEPLSDSALLLPPELDALADGHEALAGDIAINLEQRRRARINGLLTVTHEGCVLEAQETFTNCRKYIAPSVSLAGGIQVSSAERETVALDDPSVAETLSRAETAFLGSVSPEGQPDVSHRGGPPGFLTLDADAARLTWTEFIGDGMFKSVGNVRATGVASLLVLDLDSGDALEFCGRAAYENKHRFRQPREDGLVQGREDFPAQGAMTMDVEGVARLPRFILPRRRVEQINKITSCSTTSEQAPQ